MGGGTPIFQLIRYLTRSEATRTSVKSRTSALLHLKTEVTILTVVNEVTGAWVKETGNPSPIRGRVFIYIIKGAAFELANAEKTVMVEISPGAWGDFGTFSLHTRLSVWIEFSQNI